MSENTAARSVPFGQELKDSAARLSDIIGRTRTRLSRTIFTKYLFASSAIIIISFIVFGVLLAAVVTGRWQDENQRLLAKNVSGISERAGKYIFPQVNEDGTTGNYQFSEAAAVSLLAVMSTIGESVDADVFIVDAQSNLLLCSEDEQPSEDGEPTCKHRGFISDEFLRTAIAGAGRSETGDYRATGTLNNIYTEPQFIVGVPIITKDVDGSETVVGFTFAVSSAQSMAQFRSDVVSLVFFAVILAALISFAAVYIITYQQVRPLRHMARAVSRFAQGDFSVRVPVTSETEVGQLAAAFNDMATTLSQSESMRRSFVANVSHELKTPMTTISGFVDGILDGTIPSEKHNQYLAIVSAETKRLSRLVKSMLDLSRIDSGDMKLNMTKFDLSKTVTHTLISFVQMIEDKNIEILGMEKIRPLPVYGDSDLLHQVVYNLMENAVKFTNEGGYIEIRITQKDRNAYVAIKNSGIGIPSDELTRVFERFYKTDKSRSFDKKGVGLGLYIVKTILGLHGGGIEVRSEEGRYCEFEFHIPIGVR